MIDLSAVFIFYGFPISIGFVGAAASVLHGWSAPDVVKASARPSTAAPQRTEFPEAMSVLALAAKVGSILEMASGRDTLKEADATDVAVLSSVDKLISSRRGSERGINEHNNRATTSATSVRISDSLETDMVDIVVGVKRAIMDPALSSSEKILLISEAQREYCGHLGMIRKLNGGILPTDLEEEWRNNQCSQFIPST